MTESVIVALIGLLGVALGGGVMWFISLRKMPRELRLLSSQEQNNLAGALNEAVNALTQSLTAANSERKDFEDRINQLEAHRDVRSREIYTLQQDFLKLNQDYEKLNRDHAKETQKLRDEVAALQQKVAEGEEKNKTYKVVIERLIEALRTVDPHLLEGIELPDTLEKIKAVRL